MQQRTNQREEYEEICAILSTMSNPLDNLSRSTSSGALRIFLVEDSPAIRDLLIENLTSISGIVLVGVAEGEDEALSQLTQQHYDVLIMDIGLKQGNGMSLLKSLSSMPDHQAREKIIFTNNVSDTYRRAGKQYGVKFFFDKASDFLQLRALVQDLAAAAH